MHLVKYGNAINNRAGGNDTMGQQGETREYAWIWILGVSTGLAVMAGALALGIRTATELKKFEGLTGADQFWAGLQTAIVPLALGLILIVVTEAVLTLRK